MIITSLQNPLVKSVRKLHQAKARRQQQRFLLEGTHLLEEALAAAYPLELLCYTEAWQQRHGDLWRSLAGHATVLHAVSPGVMTALATTVQPDGVVAVAPLQPPGAVPVQRLALAAEALQDPGNLGTLIRTAAAAQADGLWLSADSVAPSHPKVLRASAGQWFRLPMATVPDLTRPVHDWRGAGMQVVGTRLQGGVPYWSLDFTQPTVILLGNEGAGLSPALQDLATTWATIPMAGAVESLNVAVSAALLLYEAQRQHAGGSPLAMPPSA